ncbi:hypothetical protein GSI_08756 [Ganoderma sinense ZZ0214-1]|uniref:Uncharacterized protein n=1 Tax=Ganoderma sinense ZZ0214-1 TaxID=1077348 RepID=A0A2G8S4L9_9APHY|nr:hypothetical protein GSI_08756 [Ganoderma sinense ZZ0214-1]
MQITGNWKNDLIYKLMVPWPPKFVLSTGTIQQATSKVSLPPISIMAFGETIIIYDLDSGMIVRTFKHKMGADTSKLPVEFAHGDLALLCIYDHGSVRLWDLANQVKMQTLSMRPY